MKIDELDLHKKSGSVQIQKACNLENSIRLYYM